MKTITYNPETHVIAPRDLIADAKQIFCSDVEPNTNGNCLDVIEWFSAMIAAAPQPEPNHNWCAGCSPDNCSGCGAEPVAYIFKPNNELLWPHEVDQNVFAVDPDDYDKLYTLPQPDRTAELTEALAEVSAYQSDIDTVTQHNIELQLETIALKSALNVARDALIEYSNGASGAITKINEVLHD